MSSDFSKDDVIIGVDTVETANQDVYVFPTSFAQQRLWFLDQFEPNSPFYNIPTAVRFRGYLDLGAFEKSVNEIVRRHETLRTFFAVMDGKPVQAVRPHYTLSIPLLNLEVYSEDRRQAEAMRLAAEEAQKPFNLSTGPLLRVTLLRLQENDHIVLMTMHHIISDGWSMTVLVREIAMLYEAFLNNKPSPLAELPIQYGDFSEWQQNYVTGDVLERQLNYWKKQLGGSLPILELPSDRPRPNVQTLRGASISHLLSKDVVMAVREFNRRHDATLYMTLLAVFQVLLHRYTGLDDILVGSPIANRNRAEIESLIGFFVNTLVIRTDLSDSPSFAAILQRVKKATLEAYDNQDVPFERLVEVLQPERDMSHSSLFQVMFILQNAPMKMESDLTDVTISSLDIHSGTSTFDLTLMASEEAEGISLSAEFNTDLYDEATIFRLLRHYEMLLHSVLAQPDTRIGLLNVLPKDEKLLVRDRWNDFESDYPLEKCVHQLFEEQAQRTPENIAVAFAGTYLTYEELEGKANQLGNFLQKHGVGPEVKVGICMDKSLELIVAVLGTLKTGGAYVPIDPTYPSDRIAHMIEDSAVPILITRSEGVNLPPGNHLVLDIDADWPEIAAEPSIAPQSQVCSSNLAYMIYTSGSTGKSKGTMIAHQSLANAYFAWEEDYRLRTDVSSHLQMASFSFDVFSGDFVRALLSGGKLVLVPRDLLLDAEKLYALMRSENVDCAEFVPAVLRNLIDYLDETGQKLDFMRNLIAGSDIWYVKEYRNFLRFCGPQTRLINSFGLTEAAIDSTFFEGSVKNYPKERLVPIGRPFPNSKIFILDRDFGPAPIGVPGELYVAGVNLARGYFGRPDLTAEKFIPNPFSNIPGDRFYRTGDLARWLPDGNIEFLGRMDNQVKIRGFRIELGEIETVLGKHPQVNDTVVIAREDKPGDKRLVAYIVSKNGDEPDIAAMKTLLKEHLPEYMIPSAFVVLPHLPLTPNGKVDRRSLPAPDQTAFDALRTFVEPRTDTERKLAEIWGQVLNLEKVGVEDNFFELGGHSLLATQVISRIRDGFQVELPLRSIFEFPELANLANAVENAMASKHLVKAPLIRPVPRDGQLPLSFAQERLWFLDQLEPNSPFYNIPETLRLVGDLDVSALLRSLNEIIRRHESLRTIFLNESGKPIQKILEPFDLDVPVIDLSGLDIAAREAEIKSRAFEEAQRPFDLSKGPLIRASLLRLSDHEHISLVTIHHIISDDWSSSVLFREMAILYDAFSANRPSPLPPLEIQYADFATWQRNWLQGEVLEGQLNFWKEQLSDIPALLQLPTDRPRPAVETFAGSYLTFSLPDKLSRALKDLTASEGATLFMTLMSAFQTLLHRYSGQADITVGSPIANRNRRDIEGLIGFFVNTLVFHLNFDGAPSFRQILRQCKERSIGAFANQDLPFEKLVEALQPERDLSHSPLFQVMFALQNAPVSAESESGLTIMPVEAHSGTSKFDLTLFMIEEGDKLAGALEYNTDLFNESTIQRMVRHFERLLEQMITQPDVPLDAIDFMLHQEQRFLIEWNQTSRQNELTDVFHRHFEEAAQRFGAEVAVVASNGSFTFNELNAHANQLAHFLIQHGVRPDDLVGVCMTRSLEMMVALLGILKAGAAYLPLDPSYPPERLTYMLADSGIELVLTQNELLTVLSETDAKPLCLDSEWGEIAQQSDANPSVAMSMQNLAYAIYTSGSTGKPKGTLITHEGLSNYLQWCIDTYPFGEGRGTLVNSSLAFDATVTGLFPALLLGKTVVLAQESRDVSVLGDRLNAEGDFSVIKITPAHLELLSHQLRPEDAGGRARAFVIGGENLTYEQVRFWLEKAPETRLYNEYGPTETVVGCIVYLIQENGIGTGSVPIGRPISNCQIYVLNRSMRPVPPGIVGEIYIGGVGLARGYHNRPDLTAERFVPNPFSDQAGERLYKTGDLARFLADGNLIYLGRTDEQVKIRGFRIELGEVESVLAQHPALKDVVVIAREGKHGDSDRRLVAYFTAQDEQRPTTQQLLDFLKEKLPEYMIPSAYVVLDELPLTVNGKVDRKALPAPSTEYSEAMDVYIAPRTPNEERLATIFGDVLGFERVGVTDNFFLIGGHSLIATQLVSRIRDEFMVEVPLRAIFETPTVAGLVNLIEATFQSEQALPTLPLVAKQWRADESIPLSFSQQRLWFLDQLDPGNSTFNIPAAFRIRGALEPGVLEAALNRVIERHGSMRTTFEDMEGTPVQKIAEKLHYQISMDDLSSVPATELEERIRHQVNDEATTPFDLALGPLFRIKLLKLPADEHVLLLTMHHIISDGWSMGVLVQEVIECYDALAQGREPQLPDLPIQYSDFAFWQKEYLQGAVLEQQITYWQKELLNSNAIIELPFDHPRPPVKTFNGDRMALQIDPDLSRRFAELCHHHGVTPFMGLLAVFEILLHRYSGQDDFNVGTPIANRTRSELEGLIGFFVNTLVLRANLSQDPHFAEVLQRVKNTTLGAYAHQDVSFEKLVEALQPERDLSHTPFFQVLFVLQNVPQKSMQTLDLKLESLQPDKPTVQYDLILSMQNEMDGFSGLFEYNTDLFEKSTIERMANHFNTVLRHVVANPTGNISRLDMLDADEKRLILEEWNRTDEPYEDQKCVHQLFDAQAHRTPDRIALLHAGHQLTYRELREKADQLGRYLRRAGVGPEKLVAICLDRSLDMVVAILGVLKAGGAYVPLDLSYPADRLLFMLQDSQAMLLLTRAEIAASLPKSGVALLCIDEKEAEIANESGTELSTVQTIDNLAYVIYTSGSTGRPKGTMLSHRGINNLTRSQIRDFRVTQESRVLQFASFGFDASVSEIFTALLTGATLCLASRDVLVSTPDFIRLVTEERITTVTLPPSLLKMISPEELDSVSTVISAGEVCTKEIARRWVKNRHLVNAYGPTESTVGVTSYIVDEIPVEGTTIPIGRPIANVQLYILDSNLMAVPKGVAGELYIGGVGLARGYQNRPDLTAERFVPNPFAKTPGERLYRTGDLARFLSDGNIEFLGRIDFQVKIRGFRIELGEIESMLSQHPGIREAVVIAHERTRGSDDKQIVAYFVGDSEQIPTTAELRNYLLEKVPEYMVPAVFIPLSAIPLTPNAKVDRKALPDPDRYRAQELQEYVEPQTETERTLTDLWCEVLGLEKISITANFFELGGHSLLVTQLISRIRHIFQVNLPIKSLFEAPTIAALAILVDQTRLATPAYEAPPIVPVPRDQNLPLSFAQQRLWFLDQLEPNSPMYNLPAAVRFKGSLNVAAFQKSLESVIRRHEILRTTFVTIAGKPSQVINDQADFRLNLLNWQHTTDAQRGNLDEFLAKEFLTPFNLATGPLVRAHLIKVAADESIFVLNMHHIISDGWSMGIFISEVATFYESFVLNHPASLPDLSIQYADYANWQREWLKDQVLQTHLDYWKKQLSGAPALLNLPLDRPRPAVQTFSGDTLSFEITKEITAGLQQIALRNNATLFMTLLAAFQILLHRYSGQDDIVVGTPIANRNSQETEALIGFFVNTLALRTQLVDSVSFDEVLRQVRQVALEAFAHQDLPFEMVVDAVQPERNMSHTPVFQVMFVLQNLPAQSQKLSELEIQSVEAENRIAKFDLTLTLAETDHGLYGSFEYNTDLFDTGNIERMIEHYRYLLEGVVKNSQLVIGQIPILKSDERQRMLQICNDQQTSFVIDRCIHELFEDQATRNPGAIAVSFENNHLTYAELNHHANKVANFLRRQGVGPNDLVGLCLERSIEMIVGALGILKAGAGYVPIDPMYPSDRKEFILIDSGMKILLTQKSILQELESITTRAVCLDEDWPVIDLEDDRTPHVLTFSDQVAYIIYTSGSTGKPKGVMVCHSNVTRLFRATQPWYHFNDRDVWSLFHSFAFDFSVWELWGALLYGGRVVVVPYMVSRSPELFYNLLADEKVTVLNQTPSAFRQLIQHEESQQHHGKLSLRYVIFGGDKLDLGSLKPWFGRHGFIKPLLVNMYGITETTVHVTYRPLQEIDISSAPGSMIGGPIPDLQIYILDEYFEPMPIGVAGELYVGGAGLARGYLHRPELTAERFVPHPFGDRAGERLYKTGDLARFLASGDIEYLGRIDHQVQIRGFRVELGEIESVLGTHPLIKETLVLLREDQSGEPRLVAYYVVPDDNTIVTVNELRALLKEKLPDYMVPAHFVRLERFPLTAHGKIDRGALPLPDAIRPEFAHEYVEPGTPHEILLADIWKQVLHVEKVGIYDNFFELGGDSIMSIQVVSRAQQAGLALSPRHMFQAGNLRELVILAESSEQQALSELKAIGPAPLTPIQHWFFEHHPNSPHQFNTSLMVELNQELEPAHLKATLYELFQRHDPFWLRFEKVAGVWQQEFVEKIPFVPLKEIDLSGKSRRQQKMIIEEKAALVQTTFNLSDPPLVRVVYFNLGEKRPSRLLFVLHHLITDGVSWRFIIEDFVNIYNQIKEQEELSPPIKTSTYKTWAEKLTAYAQSEELKSEFEFWKAQTIDADHTDLPVDFHGGSNTYGSVEDITLSLAAPQTQKLLQNVPTLLGVQIMEVLLTALLRTFHQWTGKEHLRIELEGHGREDLFDDVDLSHTMGWFTSIYPVFLKLRGADAAAQILELQKQLKRIPKHGIGFGVLKYLSKDDRVRSLLKAQKAPQVNFNYLGQFDQFNTEAQLPFQMAPEIIRGEQHPDEQKGALIHVVATVSGRELHTRWLYSKNVFKKQTIQKLAKIYIHELESICSTIIKS